MMESSCVVGVVRQRLIIGPKDDIVGGPGGRLNSSVPTRNVFNKFTTTSLTH
jgi:hypothetical protein